MGVAIGESGAGPATQSLLAHYFPAAQRGRAIAVWQMVFPLGSLLGIGFGGFLSTALGWRLAFVVFGAAGLALAPLVALLLADPPRPSPAATSQQPPRSLAPALREVLASRAFRLLLAGGFIAAIPLNATITWNALFYARVFGLSTSTLAVGLGVISGLGGAMGMFAGGFFGDRLGRRDVRAYCWLPAAGLTVAPLLALAQYLGAATPLASMACGFCLALALNLWMPPQAAIAQLLVRPANRALAAACILVTAGFGAAAGVFFTGVLSDLLATQIASHASALRSVLPAMAFLSLAAAGFFLRAARFLPVDLAALETTAAAPGPRGDAEDLAVTRSSASPAARSRT